MRRSSCICFIRTLFCSPIPTLQTAHKRWQKSKWVAIRRWSPIANTTKLLTINTMNTLLTQNRTISFTYFFTIKDYSLIIPMMYMLIQRRNHPPWYFSFSDAKLQLISLFRLRFAGWNVQKVHIFDIHQPLWKEKYEILRKDLLMNQKMTIFAYSFRRTADVKHILPIPTATHGVSTNLIQQNWFNKNR